MGVFPSKPKNMETVSRPERQVRSLRFLEVRSMGVSSSKPKNKGTVGSPDITQVPERKNSFVNSFKVHCTVDSVPQEELTLRDVSILKFNELRGCNRHNSDSSVDSGSSTSSCLYDSDDSHGSLLGSTHPWGNFSLVEDDYVQNIDLIALKMISADCKEDFCKELKECHSNAFRRVFLAFGVDIQANNYEISDGWNIVEDWVRAYKIFVQFFSQLKRELEETAVVHAAGNEQREFILRCITAEYKEVVEKFVCFVELVVKNQDSMSQIFVKKPEFLIYILELHDLLKYSSYELHDLLKYSSCDCQIQMVNHVVVTLEETVRGMLDRLDDLSWISDDPCELDSDSKMSKSLVRFIEWLKKHNESSHALPIVLSDHHHRFSWIKTDDYLSDLICILVANLVEKLEMKSKSLEHEGFRFIFLMNNVNCILRMVDKIEINGRLGDQWVSEYSTKIQDFMESYIATYWRPILGSLNATDACFNPCKSASLKQFIDKFHETCFSHQVFLIKDWKLRKKLQDAVSDIIIKEYVEYSKLVKNRSQKACDPGFLSDAIRNLFTPKAR